MRVAQSVAQDKEFLDSGISTSKEGRKSEKDRRTNGQKEDVQIGRQADNNEAQRRISDHHSVSPPSYIFSSFPINVSKL